MENIMSNKPPLETICIPNETAATTLAALAAQIDTFVRAGTLDSRCAARLVKRLKKEAEAIAENGDPTKQILKHAFTDVDATLRNHDAGLLVRANAALRAAEGISTTPTPR